MGKQTRRRSISPFKTLYPLKETDVSHKKLYRNILSMQYSLKFIQILVKRVNISEILRQKWFTENSCLNNLVLFIPLRFMGKNIPIAVKQNCFITKNPVKATCFGWNQATFRQFTIAYWEKFTKLYAEYIVETFVSKVPTRETICASSEYTTCLVSVPNVLAVRLPALTEIMLLHTQHPHTHTHTHIMIPCRTAPIGTFISVRMCN